MGYYLRALTAVLFRSAALDPFYRGPQVVAISSELSFFLALLSVGATCYGLLGLVHDALLLV